MPDDTVQFPAGTSCWITGWGTLEAGGQSPDTLQQAEVPLVTNAECSKNGSYPPEEITPQMLCAGEQHSFIHSFIQFIYSFIQSVSQSVSQSHTFIYSFIHSFIHSLAHLLIHSFIHSSFRLFVQFLIFI